MTAVAVGPRCTSASGTSRSPVSGRRCPSGVRAGRCASRRRLGVRDPGRPVPHPTGKHFDRAAALLGVGISPGAGRPDRAPPPVVAGHAAGVGHGGAFEEVGSTLGPGERAGVAVDRGVRPPLPACRCPPCATTTGSGCCGPPRWNARSGYRRYSADQLPTAVTIARLRSIGTSPDNDRTHPRRAARERWPRWPPSAPGSPTRSPGGPTRCNRLDELAGGRPPTPAGPASSSSPPRTFRRSAFGADTADLAVRHHAGRGRVAVAFAATARLRGAGLGRSLPLEPRGNRLAGQRLRPHRAGRRAVSRCRWPAAAERGRDARSCPRGTAYGWTTTATTTILRTPTTRPSNEIDRLGARPASRVIEDYGPLTRAAGRTRRPDHRAPAAVKLDRPGRCSVSGQSAEQPADQAVVVAFRAVRRRSCRRTSRSCCRRSEQPVDG